MGKKYKNPPIVEALCEFQFVPGQPWDITIAGMLYERIKDEFPIKQQQVGLGVTLQPREGRVIEPKIEFVSSRMQFFSNDKISLVQVGPDLLTVNHLKPYPTWEKFKTLILKILGKYIDIGSPKGFRRIGLRYINKINIPGESIKMEDYFNFYLPIPEELPQIHSAFNISVEIPYKDDYERLVLTLGNTMSEKPGTVSIILDLYYIMAMPEKVSFEQVDEWMEGAHTIIEKAFESCITNNVKNLFEEEE